MGTHRLRHAGVQAVSQTDIAKIVKGYASYYSTTIDSEGLGIWVKALAEFSPEEVKRAFEAHRGDQNIGDFGKMVGETWPRSTRIEYLIKQARRPVYVQKGCRNPECSSGWVTDYFNDRGVRFVKRCHDCKRAA